MNAYYIPYMKFIEVRICIQYSRVCIEINVSPMTALNFNHVIICAWTLCSFKY